jgi:hypothetical protein
VVRHLKIGHERLAEPLKLHVLRVVPSNRHVVGDDVRYQHHLFAQLYRQLALDDLNLVQPRPNAAHLRLNGLGLVAPTLRHQPPYLLAYDIPFVA